MNLLSELQRRFAAALVSFASDTTEFAEMVRPSQDPKFGDYQANFAMPLGKRLGRPPRDIAAEVVAAVDVSDLCEPPEIAGPGFINLRLKNSLLTAQLEAALTDPRLGIAPVKQPRTYVIDFSAPNVAKPMHVGHIRSTVIGDSLYRTLQFLGHQVIGDNHLGDWGTQFGMIIYGYRHFRDEARYRESPVDELARLYKLVNRLVDYHDTRDKLPVMRQQIERLQTAVTRDAATPLPPGDKKAAQARKRQETQLAEVRGELAAAEAKLAEVDSDVQLSTWTKQHGNIGSAVLAETARLHAGDAENLRLWHEFLPPCLEAIDQIYRRLGVRFDHTLGESFYHDRLAGVVADLAARGIARQSDGAMCVFLEGYATPMIVQKQDGAFLYATTDLATIDYRMKTWSPDAMLYVVDHRQGLHFEQLFATARKWGYEQVELQHISFGTVLGDDGRPFKTRSGDTVGLSGLLDEAVRRARQIEPPSGIELSEHDRDRIAEAVGIAALKYADLSQNRTSDYVFSYDKMLAMNGNTATYMQYAYARVRSIFAKGGVDAEVLRASSVRILLDTPAERALALALLRFEEALAAAVSDYRPHQLTAYLFELANCYSTFFENCPVLKAPTPDLRNSRLALCDLCARTLKKGLELLGIEVVEKM